MSTSVSGYVAYLLSVTNGTQSSCVKTNKVSKKFEGGDSASYQTLEASFVYQGLIHVTLYVFNCGVLDRGKSFRNLVKDNCIIWSIYDPKTKRCRRLVRADQHELFQIKGIVGYVMGAITDGGQLVSTAISPVHTDYPGQTDRHAQTVRPTQTANTRPMTTTHTDRHAACILVTMKSYPTV